MRLLLVVLGLLLSVAGWAQGVGKQNPPPQFTSGYEVPVARAPMPRPEVFAIIDVVTLVAVMAIGAWMVLGKRSRREVRVLSVFALVYFGFYRLGCVCAIGSVQNVAFASTHSNYLLPWVVAAFFALPLVAALFFGRVFCGSACPMGALQDLALFKPVKVPGWLAGPLSVLPYAYLGAGVAFAALGTAFVICEYDPFIALFRLNGHAGMVIFGGGMVLLSMFVGRPYCRFLCPYGVLLRWASVFSSHRVKVTPDECLNCHMCADACPYDAIQPPQTDPGPDRLEERRRAGWRVAMVPVLVLLLAYSGYRLSPAIARWDARVARAVELRQEELDPKIPKTIVMDAWRQLRKDREDAYIEAARVEQNYAVAMPILGGWIGLVIGLRAVFLALRRRRKEYEVDSADCVHCARCYSACPVPNRPQFRELKNLLEGRP